jgi:hypothetical protein
MGEKIKKTENFDSSDEDESKGTTDTFGIPVKYGGGRTMKLKTAA